ncbi:MAG: hypothetical protein HYV33_05525 [Candidatus Kerfeldbacteria bacterium]|nr:hypothetical protein [Candidatus Kerfeldbacteria bacterium]
MTDPRLYAFLKNLVRTVHATVLPEALEEKMIMDLSLQLEQRLETIITEQLSDNDAVEYASLIQREAPQNEVTTFLNSRIPDLSQQLQTAIKQFEQEYVEFTQP